MRAGYPSIVSVLFVLGIHGYPSGDGLVHQHGARAPKASDASDH